MIKAREPGSFLTDLQKNLLLDRCDEDGFMERLDHLAEDLHFHRHNEMSAGIKISFFENRKKISRPGKVPNEIDKAIKFMEELPAPVLMHILRNQHDKNKRPFAEYYDLLHSLKQPYVAHEKFCLRDYFIDQMILIVGEYDIHVSSGQKSDLTKILEIICVAADAPYSGHEVSKKLVKKLKERF